MAIQTTPLTTEVTVVLGPTNIPDDGRTIRASTDANQPAIKEFEVTSGVGFFLTAAWYTPISGLDGMPSMTRLEVQEVGGTNRSLVKVFAAGKPGVSARIRIRITALNQTNV